MHLAVKIVSNKLNGATVWLATDRDAARKLWMDNIRDPIFLPEEIEAMKGIPDTGLSMLYEQKKVFPGCIVEPWQPPPTHEEPTAIQVEMEL